MDDEELLRATLGRMLEAFGYKAILLGDGKSAVDFLKEEIASNRKVAGMIFDLTIPGGMGGFPGVPQHSPQDILAAHGLKADETRVLDADNRVDVTAWRRS